MERIPIIIDVDTGLDDAICITCALLYQDVLDIRAFTAVNGNVSLDKTARNTLNLVRSLGAEQTVARGAERPLVREPHPAISHGPNGFGDVALPEAEQVFDPLPASELIWNEAVRAKGRLNVLAVGPLTNLAIAIQEHPEIVNLIERVTIMGGGLWGGNMTMTSEFNIYQDPEAAKIVFDSGVKLFMVGLDVTLKPKLPEYVVNEVEGLNSPHGAVVAKIFNFMRRRKAEYGGDDPNLHDVIALAALVTKDIVRFNPYYMTVETEGSITRGMTVADFNGVENRPANVNAAVEIDIDAFWRWFLDTLRRSEENGKG